MGSYIANTKEEQYEMLHELGVARFEDLFSNIPAEVKEKTLNIPQGLSELEVYQKMKAISKKNKVYEHIFRGAGAYNHYIPSIVKSVSSKEEFMTAYTPYQAEISQGILQSIFEFQTMICELTGMDASNASVYDGATAAAEAIAMCKEKNRNTALVSSTTDPQVIEVLKTYCFGSGMKLEIVSEKNGITDFEELQMRMDSGTACFYLQQPNYYGIFEEAEAIGEIVHAAGAKYIMGCNPIALGFMKTPAECGADIAVGEGQPLGLELSFGGPYLGYMATIESMQRKLPGRIAGETVDQDGKRAYVLTLQAREQHIRREKASSNACSNQALCALRAGAYMATLGEKGMQQVASLCISKAHYFKDILLDAGMELAFQQQFFHEFVTTSNGQATKILEALDQNGILGGLNISEHEILWCVTEQNTKEEMDMVAKIIKEVLVHETDI